MHSHYAQFLFPRVIFKKTINGMVLYFKSDKNIAKKMFVTVNLTLRFLIDAVGVSMERGGGGRSEARLAFVALSNDTEITLLLVVELLVLFVVVVVVVVCGVSNKDVAAEKDMTGAAAESLSNKMTRIHQYKKNFFYFFILFISYNKYEFVFA
jgi:hypothetical protein